MENEIINELKRFIEYFTQKKSIELYEIKINGPSGNENNLMGIVIFFEIISKEKTFHLAMKTARKSDELREKLPVVLQYKRELYAYSEIFPAFRKFIQEESPKFSFDFFPEFYWLCSEEKCETLVLKDMRYEGYRMLNSKKIWNLEHSLLVMEHYGKFHALSFALKDKKPGIFSKMVGKLPPLNFEYRNVMNCLDYLINILKYSMNLLEEAGRNDLVQKFNAIKTEFVDTLNYKVPAEDKLVICHADCWNNNFLFKYDDERFSEPSRVCFLDFQLVTYHSPVVDLSMNIYSTCDHSILENFDVLLDTYYKSLWKNIECLGSRAEDLFTYEQLREHWRKYALYGLILMHVSVKLSLFNTDEYPDLIEMSEGKWDFQQCLKFQGKNELEFRRRILEAFIHFGDTFL
ncbi:hypothetical protein WA026_005408 [Henosepilachna vigintioctopunctata]|uniref:CHK kinase-like domain-containing protein n=1 Tax=Henosepilachna vigintioctopunctata TaxID=420089 RepID=A0AAW1U119_9CUCU